MQHTRHNNLSQFHMDKYLYQKTTTENAYPLNREAINGKIIGLKGKRCLALSPFQSTYTHLFHSFSLFPFGSLV